MINNIISGGQVFLHKIRMLRQVVSSSILVSFVFSLLISGYYYLPELQKQDKAAAMTYLKAKAKIAFYEQIGDFSSRAKRKIVMLDSYDKNGLYRKNMKAKSVLNSKHFQVPYDRVTDIAYRAIMFALYLKLFSLLLIFAIWGQFGKFMKKDKHHDDLKVLNASQVSSWLRIHGKASNIVIGDMPLVKNSETQHILVTGSTGSGKTNLIHNILKSLQERQEPAFVIDQTGEMIATYYNKERGDIIFNPFDNRGTNWDFWADCYSDTNSHTNISERLEKFAKILFGFNSRGNNMIASDPFWQNSAEIVFTSCVEYLARSGKKDLGLLQEMISTDSFTQLQKKLAKLPASRYLVSSNKNTASSILSVLATSTKPLLCLHGKNNVNGQNGGNCNNNGQNNNNINNHHKFSLLEYFKGIREGKDNWIFLASPPGKRELVTPLIASLAELAMSFLIELGVSDKKTWFIIDELASLGRLPALDNMMVESRKYGGSVVAGLQGINQLYNIYNHHGGTTIFSQFATKFFFRSHEPNIAKVISDMCGISTITKQQKNISFGASNFRDGVGYTEQEKRLPLVEFKDIAKLGVGQCYCLLPEPAVRLCKLDVPQANVKNVNPAFVPLEIRKNKNSVNNKKKQPVKSKAAGRMLATKKTTQNTYASAPENKPSEEMEIF